MATVLTPVFCQNMDIAKPSTTRIESTTISSKIFYVAIDCIKKSLCSIRVRRRNRFTVRSVNENRKFIQSGEYCAIT